MGIGKNKMCQNCDNFVKGWKEDNLGREPADECNCSREDRVPIDVVHHGEFKELFEFCDNCGGIII